MPPFGNGPIRKKKQKKKKKKQKRTNVLDSYAESVSGRNMGRAASRTLAPYVADLRSVPIRYDVLERVRVVGYTRQNDVLPISFEWNVSPAGAVHLE